MSDHSSVVGVGEPRASSVDDSDCTSSSSSSSPSTSPSSSLCDVLADFYIHPAAESTDSDRWSAARCLTTALGHIESSCAFVCGYSYYEFGRFAFQAGQDRGYLWLTTMAFIFAVTASAVSLYVRYFSATLAPRPRRRHRFHLATLRHALFGVCGLYGIALTAYIIGFSRQGWVYYPNHAYRWCPFAALLTVWVCLCLVTVLAHRRFRYAITHVDKIVAAATEGRRVRASVATSTDSGNDSASGNGAERQPSVSLTVFASRCASDSTFSFKSEHAAPTPASSRRRQNPCGGGVAAAARAKRMLAREQTLRADRTLAALETLAGRGSFIAFFSMTAVTRFVDDRHNDARANLYLVIMTAACAFFLFCSLSARVFANYLHLVRAVPAVYSYLACDVFGAVPAAVRWRCVRASPAFVTQLIRKVDAVNALWWCFFVALLLFLNGMCLVGFGTRYAHMSQELYDLCKPFAFGIGGACIVVYVVGLAVERRFRGDEGACVRGCIAVFTASTSRKSFQVLQEDSDTPSDEIDDRIDVDDDNQHDDQRHHRPDAHVAAASFTSAFVRVGTIVASFCWYNVITFHSDIIDVLSRQMLYEGQPIPRDRPELCEWHAHCHIHSPADTDVLPDVWLFAAVNGLCFTAAFTAMLLGTILDARTDSIVRVRDKNAFAQAFLTRSLRLLAAMCFLLSWGCLLAAHAYYGLIKFTTKRTQPVVASIATAIVQSGVLACVVVCRRRVMKMSEPELDKAVAVQPVEQRRMSSVTLTTVSPSSAPATPLTYASMTTLLNRTSDAAVWFGGFAYYGVTFLFTPERDVAVPYLIAFGATFGTALTAVLAVVAWSLSSASMTPAQQQALSRTCQWLLKCVVTLFLSAVLTFLCGFAMIGYVRDFGSATDDVDYGMLLAVISGIGIVASVGVIVHVLRLSYKQPAATAASGDGDKTCHDSSSGSIGVDGNHDDDNDDDDFGYASVERTDSELAIASSRVAFVAGNSYFEVLFTALDSPTSSVMDATYMLLCALVTVLGAVTLVLVMITLLSLQLQPTLLQRRAFARRLTATRTACFYLVNGIQFSWCCCMLFAGDVKWTRRVPSAWAVGVVWGLLGLVAISTAWVSVRRHWARCYY